MQNQHRQCAVDPVDAAVHEARADRAAVAPVDAAVRVAHDDLAALRRAATLSVPPDREAMSG